MSKPSLKSQAKQSDTGTINALFIALPLLVISLIYATKTVDLVLLPKFIAFAIFSIFINAIALKNSDAFNTVKQHLFFKIYLVYLITAQWVLLRKPKM